MDRERDPYLLIHEKLPALSVQIRDLARDPGCGAQVLGSIDQILEASRTAGGKKLRADVEKLVGQIRHYLKHPQDPLLVQQVLDGILRLRQDATEI